MFSSTRLQGYYNTPRKYRESAERKEAWLEEYDMLIKWWVSYRNRNAQLDPETYILDKIGTINGVIRELTRKQSAIAQGR